MRSSIPTIDQLQRATKIALQIQTLEAELASILGGEQPVKAKRGRKAAAPAAADKPKRKYTFSPEARAKIAAAQKKRWAKAKKAKAAAAE